MFINLLNTYTYITTLYADKWNQRFGENHKRFIFVFWILNIRLWFGPAAYSPILIGCSLLQLWLNSPKSLNVCVGDQLIIHVYTYMENTYVTMTNMDVSSFSFHCTVFLFPLTSVFIWFRLLHTRARSPGRGCLFREVRQNPYFFLETADIWA